MKSQDVLGTIIIGVLVLLFMLMGFWVHDNIVFNRRLTEAMITEFGFKYNPDPMAGKLLYDDDSWYKLIHDYVTPHGTVPFDTDLPKTLEEMNFRIYKIELKERNK